MLFFFCSDRIGTRENCTTVNFGFVSLFCLLLRTLWQIVSQIYISISFLGSCQSEMTTLCVLHHPHTISIADEMCAFLKNFTSALGLHLRRNRLLHFPVDYTTFLDSMNKICFKHRLPSSVSWMPRLCGCSYCSTHHTTSWWRGRVSLIDSSGVNQGPWSCCFEFRVR